MSSLERSARPGTWCKHAKQDDQVERRRRKRIGQGLALGDEVVLEKLGALERCEPRPRMLQCKSARINADISEPHTALRQKTRKAAVTAAEIEDPGLSFQPRPDAVEEHVPPPPRALPRLIELVRALGVETPVDRVELPDGLLVQGAIVGGSRPSRGVITTPGSAHVSSPSSITNAPPTST